MNRARRSPAAGAGTPQLTGANTMTRILIPVGGTRNDRFAVQHVIKRFMNNTAMEVHLVNVQTAVLGVRRPVLQPEEPPRLIIASRPRRRSRRRRRCSTSSPFPTRCTWRSATRPALITETARRLRCDEIVMATARKNSLTRLVESSVTDRVHRVDAGARRGDRGRLDVELGALRHSVGHRRGGGDGAGDRGLTSC